MFQGQPRYGGFMMGQQQRSMMGRTPTQSPSAPAGGPPIQEAPPSYMPQSQYVPSPGLAGNVNPVQPQRAVAPQQPAMTHRPQAMPIQRPQPNLDAGPGIVPSPEEQQRMMPRPMSGGQVY